MTMKFGKESHKISRDKSIIKIRTLMNEFDQTKLKKKNCEHKRQI